MDDPELEEPRPLPDHATAEQTNDVRDIDRGAWKGPNAQGLSVLAPTPTSTPASPSLIPLASHEQDYHKRIGFRLFIALIMLYSMGIILYAVSLSLLFDIGWAYFGVLTSLAFMIVVLTLWGLCLTVWFHIKSRLERRLGLGRATGKRRLHLTEVIVGWIGFLIMLGGHGAFMWVTLAPIPTQDAG